MNKARNEFFKNLTYLCLIGVIALGLMTIVGTGGGGGSSDGTSAPPDFATSDLSGTWYIYGASSGGTSEGTIRGTVVLNSSGQVTGGSYNHSDGTVASLTGGAITINGSGVISGAATTDIGVDISIASGKMNSSKNIMSFVDSTNYDEFDLIFAVKGN